jgi:hypothetical protein
MSTAGAMFPEGYFYIEFCDKGFVLDVYDGKEKVNALNY